MDGFESFVASTFRLSFQKNELKLAATAKPPTAINSPAGQALKLFKIKHILAFKI